MKITKNQKEIMSKVDHTVLGQTATWEMICQACDDAIAFEAASVCIPPSYIKRAKAYVGDRMPITTVIGFPNGYSTTSAKAFEADDAIKKGADEIDMVINLGDLKDKNYKAIQDDIRTLKMVCANRILKVIIETCLLTEEEKIRMCEIVSASGADYIKTSTGFSTGGATVEDIRLFAQHIAPEVKIKAAGGIADFEQAQALLDAGASRLGASRLAKILKEKVNG